MGHSTGSGRTPAGGAVAPENRLDSARFNSAVNESRGRALTSQDVKKLENELESGSKNGDVIEARENNRWHSITSSYRKTRDGWEYTRTNNDTGEVYENRTVSSHNVALEVLGTYHSNEPTFWQFRRTR